MKKTKTSAAASHQSDVRENVKKWGQALMDAGWTCIPSTVILRQRALGLDSVDMNIILIIAAHWWHASNLPFPSKKLIAQTIGIDVSNVRKRIAKLEKGNLIQRTVRPVPGDRHKSNVYDFSGLIEATEGYAKEELERRETQREERAARAKRKGKPKLKLVKQP